MLSLLLATASSPTALVEAAAGPIVQTDDGPVELLPGEKDVISVGGNSYEVTVVSAFQVEARPRALLPCGGIGDMLSFELVRVESGEPDFVERPEGAAMAHLGCL